MTEPPITRQIIERGRRLGFALVGVCRAEPSRRETFVRQWLADGKHGSMAYLARHLETRLDPTKLLTSARFVIVVADRYDSATRHEPRAMKGRVARYAWGSDYHKTIKKRLHALTDALSAEHPGHQFRCTVDTAPILEREHAARAGLGWIGKHTLLIHPRQGSYFLLGAIVTTLELEPTGEPVADHCGTCTRCIDACPTHCIDANGYSLDASRCISYLTIEHRSPIAPSLHAAMGDWIAGCDVCQEVCPFNQRGEKWEERGETARSTAKVTSFDLLEVLGWSEDDRRVAFRGSALKRIKLDMMKRNALIAAGNVLKSQAKPSPDRSKGTDIAAQTRLYRRIAKIAADESESELARLTAKQVLADLPTAPPDDATGPSGP